VYHEVRLGASCWQGVGLLGGWADSSCRIHSLVTRGFRYVV